MGRLFSAKVSMMEKSWNTACRKWRNMHRFFRVCPLFRSVLRNSVTGFIRWSHLQKKMQKQFWSRYTAGRRLCTKNMESTLSMRQMNGTFLQGRNFRKKDAMMDICSWKTELVCSGFWIQKCAKPLPIEMAMTGHIMLPLRQAD